MSINALNSTISSIRADGHISTAEAATLTRTPALGTSTTVDKFERAGSLTRDIEVPNATTIQSAEKPSLLKRGVKVGAIIGTTVVGVGTVGLIALAAALPFYAGAASAVVALTAAVGGLFAIAAGVGSVIILKEIYRRQWAADIPATSAPQPPNISPSAPLRPQERGSVDFPRQGWFDALRGLCGQN